VQFVLLFSELPVVRYELPGSGQVVRCELPAVRSELQALNRQEDFGSSNELQAVRSELPAVRSELDLLGVRSELPENPGLFF
jgi:hypothetical protein